MIYAIDACLWSFFNMSGTRSVTFTRKQQPLAMRRSFTFIELIIVIVIIGIVATAGIVSFRATSESFQLQSFTKDIYSACQLLRASAIAHGRTYCLTITQGSTIELVPAVYDEDASRMPLRGRLAKTYRVPEGVSLVLEPPDRSVIFFYPDGSAEPTIMVWSNKNKQQTTLKILGPTGAIQIT